jgi:hypothetical protein
MMSKLFIPPLGSAVRLLENWFLEHSDRYPYYYSRYVLRKANAGLVETDWRGRAIFNKETDFVPAGTVVRFDRYHLGKSEQRVTVSLIASPNPLLTPKKNGGKGSGHDLKFDVPVADLNTMEYELVDITA